jgi:hypothetical protein
MVSFIKCFERVLISIISYLFPNEVLLLRLTYSCGKNCLILNSDSLLDLTLGQHNSRPSVEIFIL